MLIASMGCHNFSLLAADVEADVLCKGVKALRLLLNECVGV